jgi:hypothetical protein
VQHYLNDPLLLDGKKFDLRIYVMITSLNPMTAYLASEGLVRVCTEDYQKPDKSNMHNLLSHLTNYSLNKMSSNYVHTSDLEN